jgi:hypothetical protein
VIIIGTGIPVVPPVMSVLEPTVSVTAEKLHVVSNQTTTVAFSVVVVGSSMDVVPSQTLYPCKMDCAKGGLGMDSAYGVTVMVKGGGWMELVR